MTDGRKADRFVDTVKRAKHLEVVTFVGLTVFAEGELAGVLETTRYSKLSRIPQIITISAIKTHMIVGIDCVLIGGVYMYFFA